MISLLLPEKPDAARTSEQVVDFMLKSLETEDFYILCPDNNADDLIKNRPALSRWHADYSDAFSAFMKK